MWQQACTWLSRVKRASLAIGVFVVAGGIGARVLNEVGQLVAKVSDRSEIEWGVRVLATLALTAGVIAVAIGFERGRDSVPLWLFALTLVALGCQMATDWRPREATTTGRYSVLTTGGASLLRVDTATGAIDACARPEGGSFTCVRIEAGPTSVTASR